MVFGAAEVFRIFALGSLVDRHRCRLSSTKVAALLQPSRTSHVGFHQGSWTRSLGVQTVPPEGEAAGCFLLMVGVSTLGALHSKGFDRGITVKPTTEALWQQPRWSEGREGQTRVRFSGFTASSRPADRSVQLPLIGPNNPWADSITVQQGPFSLFDVGRQVPLRTCTRLLDG